MTIDNISKSVLDLDKTLDCGETFRWMKVGKYWVGVVDNNLIQLEQLEKSNQIRTNLPDNLESKYWFIKYFDLCTDYSGIDRLDLSNDRFARESIEAGKGIRILRQDLWETMVSFIISQQNNIPKIKKTIYKLCDIAGRPVNLPGPLWGIDDKTVKTLLTLKTFPTASEIVQHEQEILEQCPLGYRANYVLTMAHKYQHNYTKYAMGLTCLDPANQTASLLREKGIGPKVASCISLFALHNTASFPIDVWVKRIIDTYYNGNIDISKYGEYAGIIQQYMFYNIRNK